MKPKPNFKLILYIIVLSSVLGLLFNNFYSKGISLIKEEKEITFAQDSVFNNEEQFHTESLDEVQLKEPQYISNADSKKLTSIESIFITLPQAYSLHKMNSAIFIDARDKWDFADGHIKGAINIPHYNFEPDNPIMKKFHKEKTLVTYCGGDDCDMSSKLADELIKIGFRKVYVFFGGWNDWTKAGYDTEKGNL